MSNLSNKKRKFIKRNFKQFSIEKLARKTGLKPDVVRSFIEEYSAEMSGKNQTGKVKNGDGIFPPWKNTLLISLLFAVITIIIYSPSLHGPFVFDDISIQDNPLIHTSRISQLTDIVLSKEIGRKIGHVSFALNYYFGGLNTFGYHLVNVIIHILNGLILFLLTYTILTLPIAERKARGDAFKIAFLGSLIWLVHPIQTQAVSYIIQRLTSLSTLFFLVSLLCYIKGRVCHDHKRITLFICSLLFGLLALSTKQNAATLPLFIILTEFFFFQPQPLKMERKKLGILILLGGLFILVSWIYLGPDFISKIAQQYERRGWTPIERMMTELRVVVFYMSLLIYPRPSRLNLDHDFSISHSLFSPFTTFLSLLVIIGLIAVAIFLKRRNRLVSYAIFWFLGNLIIESSIIPLELVFEHRLYLPSMGFILLVTALCFGLIKREWKKWVTALIIPLILLFSYWTYERASVWGNTLNLWTDAVKKSPNKARPHDGLGFAYDEKGMLNEAISEYKKAITINPRYAKAYNDLGVVYNKKGMFDEAILACKKALSGNTNFAAAHNNLGTAYVKKGRLDEAITEFKQALAIDSYYIDARNNLGSAYKKKGMLDEAISEFKKIIAVDLNYAKAHYNLGTSYAKKRQWNKAIVEYKQAIDINPDYAEAHINLAVAYYAKGKYKLAITHCDKAVELGYGVNPRLLEMLKRYR